MNVRLWPALENADPERCRKFCTGTIDGKGPG